jgi:hypothetical protein
MHLVPTEAMFAVNNFMELCLCFYFAGLLVEKAFLVCGALCVIVHFLVA